MGEAVQASLENLQRETSVVFFLRCEVQNPTKVFLTIRTFRTSQHIRMFSVTVKASHTAA